jgi:hypothetical protein
MMMVNDKSNEDLSQIEFRAIDPAALVWYDKNMTTITIPKEMIRKNDDLVLIPRKEYETLSRLRVMAPTVKMTS